MPYLRRHARRAVLSGVSALLSLAPCLLPSAHAANDKGQFGVRGVGSLPCAQVVAKIDAKAPDVPNLVAWADGAHSLYNRGEADTFDAIPFASPMGLTTILALNICRANPQALYVVAVLQALETMRPLRLRQAEQGVPLTVGDRTVSIKPETLRLVQTKLRERKLLATAADGKWNAETQAAIKKFQQSANLPTTEVPDPDTVFRLVLNPPAK
jgi:hypothetical protein